MKFLTKDSKKSLSYKYYYIPALVLTLAGIADTVYLAFSHYKNYTDIAFASFCAISKAVNCDTVSQSPWSILLGIPVAFWGLAGYVLFLIFLIPVGGNSENNRPLWSVLFVLALLYSLAAVFFGYISAVEIQSYCILCLLSYSISFSLLLYSWIIRRRFCDGSLLMNIKQSLSLFIHNSPLKFGSIALLLSVFILGTFMPHYWQYQFPEPDHSLPHGITENGHPWIGASNPTVTIEEFTDYQCFQCAKMHHYLRQLVVDNPKQIRLVHRNYPMDHEVNPHVVPEPFHVGSARLALLSIAAMEQDKFWQVNDALFKAIRVRESVINIREIANQAQTNPATLAETVYAKQTIKTLEADIRAGLRHKITGTPTYIIDNKVYEGFIPPEIIKKITVKTK